MTFLTAFRSKLIIQITFNASNIITDSKILFFTNLFVTSLLLSSKSTAIQRLYKRRKSTDFILSPIINFNIKSYNLPNYICNFDKNEEILPTSTPQNGNILSLKYLVKLIGLNGKEELMISAENTTSALFFFQHQVLLGQNTLKLDGSNWLDKVFYDIWKEFSSEVRRRNYNCLALFGTSLRFISNLLQQDITQLSCISMLRN
ncbi:hypothetical protein GLOIN_2v1471271 [Rhizophagus irregularis DAOM 181602=DAOM 197198]|nr:hypothetical protein GLOIN_2v1471271 [Rhizophagus irregularis DAOM 181602=DAOM 197198]